MTEIQMVNICDQCDKTKCLCTNDPIEGHANVMHCRKEWGRLEVSEYLSRNGWTKHQLEDYWDYDPAEDYECDEDEYDEE